MKWPFAAKLGQSQSGGQGNTQNIGMPPDLFIAEMQRKDSEISAHIAEKAAFIERLHIGDQARQKLEFELEQLRSRHDAYQALLANPQQAYAEHIQRGSQTEQLLQDTATVQGLGENRILSALNAFSKLNYGEIDDLLAETEQKGLLIAANAAFGRGLIAEDAVKWQDAAKHYANAARLNPTFGTLAKARVFTWRSGDYMAALRLGEDLIEVARKHGSQEMLAAAMNEHAVTLTALGHYKDAEQLFRRALKIERSINGKVHLNYASCLNNLAGAAKAQGRLVEAEKLFRQALKIDRKTIGMADPIYAVHLNNLADVVLAQGRLDEAVPLFCQALEISRSATGEFHPDFASHLNNFARVLAMQGHFTEAETFFRQSLEIDRKTIGEAHPDHAIHLKNLAILLEQLFRFAEAKSLYAQMLQIWRNSLGNTHPFTQKGAADYLDLLLDHFPEDPEIPVLHALLSARNP